MSWNTGRWDTGSYDVVIIGSTEGIRVIQCKYWVESSTHGGDISDPPVEVDSLFDYISHSENVNGNTDYRKCYLLNNGEDSGDKVLRPLLMAPPGLNTRMTVEIAAGLDYDDMTNKPADENFSESLAFNIGTGESTPFWLKRTISADASPDWYLDVMIILAVSEA